MRKKKENILKKNMSEKAWENNRRERAESEKKLGIPWCYFMYIRLFPLILLIFADCLYVPRSLAQKWWNFPML